MKQTLFIVLALSLFAMPGYSADMPLRNITLCETGADMDLDFKKFIIFADLNSFKTDENGEALPEGTERKSVPASLMVIGTPPISPEALKKWEQDVNYFRINGFTLSKKITEKNVEITLSGKVNYFMEIAVSATFTAEKITKVQTHEAAVSFMGGPPIMFNCKSDLQEMFE